MNRRNFIKRSVVATGIAAVASGLTLKSFSATEPISNDLKDLYSYLESHTIIHPIKGKIPFKLYPYQKEILKNIHENDKVVIVKARQIGMTTLLAGYMAWLNAPRLYKYSADIYGMYEHFHEKYDTFIRPDKTLTTKFSYLYDEFNYNTIPFPYVGVKQIEKLIIAGTPDGEENLKWVVDRKDRLGLKVFTYSAYDCYPMWDEEKISVYSYWLHNNDKWLKRDIEAKFV